VASGSVQEFLVKVAGDRNRVCTIAVCQDEPQKSIATALYLPEMVLKRVHQVLVYQRNNFDLINKVATGEKEWKRYDKLKPFGMITDCYKGDMFDSILPKLVLSLYKDKNHKIKIFSNVKMDYFIDYINRIWSEEGIVNKLSNINVTDCFKSKLRSVGLTPFSSKTEIEKVLKDETMMACLEAAEHYRWLTERLTMGYRPLDKDEIDFFMNPISETASDDDRRKAAKERKAKKEYYKSKSRAHLDICSFDMLDKVDPGVKGNDARIIRNLIDQTFYTVESRIISRLALREEKDNVEKSENLQIAALFLRDMVKLPPKVMKQKDESSTDIPPLWVGKYPVTQRLWKRIMGRENNPSIGVGKDLDEHPVNNVSKEDVEDFILILNDITGLRFSLPSKSEWKYAALGTWRVQQFSKQTKISEHAWFLQGTSKLDYPSQGAKRTDGGEQTHPVGLKAPNKYGLHDMLGNVWEWTQTKHGASTFVFCGGSWRYSAKECDLSDPNEPWCNYWTPEHKSDDLGFRLVLHHSFTMNFGPKQEEMIETKKMISNIIQHLVQVPSGEFFMGTNDAGVLDGVMKKDGTPTNTYIPTLSDERPAHMVKMSDFLISDIPVTQRHYSAFMDENPSEQKGDDLPVENVSYRDAVVFIKQLNEYCCGTLLNSADVPENGIIVSLPTQAQWEYAGREAKSSQLSYTIYSGSNNPDVVAWHYGNTKNIHPVGMKSPNALNIYDMCGNVWEWCSDWYQADYYSTCCEEGVLVDPKGPDSGVTRVLRGGSWRFTAGECRLTRMAHWTEDYKASDVGFRLVANVDKAVIDKLIGSIKESKQE
jgi:formylglycine-generating enzyme required for sulfatase activity